MGKILGGRFLFLRVNLLLTALLVCCTTYQGLAQELQSVDGWMVVDSRGNRVGRVLGVSNPDNAVIGFESDGRVFQINVWPGGFRFGGGVLFTSPNCQGQPYVPVSKPPLFMAFGIIATPGHTVWVGQLEVPPQTITVVSVLNDTCQASTFSTWALPAIPVVNLDELFLPPFKLATDTTTGVPDHAHTYLTGKGEGHNNVTATTGGMIRR